MAKPAGHRKSRPAPPVEERSRESLSDRAYAELRERVLSLALPAGQLLNERMLCDMLGLGRTPIHHALQRLHLEGLVEIVPRKGVIVQPDSIARVLDLLDARLVIEPQLARRAAERATPQNVAELKNVASAHSKPDGSAASAVDRFVERDRAFHAKIAAISASPALIEIQRTLHERAIRFWYAYLWQTLDEESAADEHHDVIDAIGRGDGDAAAAAMAVHIEKISGRLRRLQAIAPNQTLTPLR